MYKILLAENEQNVLNFLRDTIEKSFPQKCKIKTEGGDSGSGKFSSRSYICRYTDARGL